VISHERRRILHCNVSRNPQALWVSLQLLQTWEYDKQPQRFLLFDRDSKFTADVVATVKAVGCQLRTALRSPWQNGVAERWVGSVRRDLQTIGRVDDQGMVRALNGPGGAPPLTDSTPVDGSGTWSTVGHLLGMNLDSVFPLPERDARKQMERTP